MRKTIFSLVFALMMLSGSALALNVEITPKLLKVESGELASFTLALENDQSYTDEVEISVDGPVAEWVQDYQQKVKLQPGEIRKLKLSLLPEERGQFLYSVTATSLRYVGIIVQKNFTVDVLYPLNIASLDVQKTNDRLELVMDLEAIGRQAGTIFFRITDSKGAAITEFSIDVDVEMSKRVTRYIDISGMLAGEYGVSASIPDTGLYKEAGFTIEPVRNVVEKKTLTSNPFFSVVEVTIENQGNVPVENYEYYQDVPNDAFTGFVTKPDNCFDEGDGTRCLYTINEIRPGMTAKIIYRVDLWPILGGYALGLIGLVSGAGMAYRKTAKPKIRKRSVKKGDEHVVYLELRNKFMKDIESLVVRDWVSPLAAVVNQFDTIKPVIRKSDAGTELIWKLSNIKEKDDRLLSYKLKSMVTGEIKMPKATVHFKKKNGSTGKVYSNPLILR